MALIVRTDTFEVSATVPLFRVIFPMDYYFRARDTTIEVSELPSFIQKTNWIVVRGQQGGTRIELAIAAAAAGTLPAITGLGQISVTYRTTRGTGL